MRQWIVNRDTFDRLGRPDYARLTVGRRVQKIGRSLCRDGRLPPRECAGGRRGERTVDALRTFFPCPLHRQPVRNCSTMIRPIVIAPTYNNGRMLYDVL